MEKKMADRLKEYRRSCVKAMNQRMAGMATADTHEKAEQAYVVLHAVLSPNIPVTATYDAAARKRPRIYVRNAAQNPQASRGTEEGLPRVAR